MLGPVVRVPTSAETASLVPSASGGSPDAPTRTTPARGQDAASLPGVSLG